MIGFANNEAIDLMMNSNRSIILCKLDLEKAYGHMNWSFLCLVLDKMGSAEK